MKDKTKGIFVIGSNKVGHTYNFGMYYSIKEAEKDIKLRGIPNDEYWFYGAKLFKKLKMKVNLEEFGGKNGNKK